jgi:methionyl-tRNA formyltransferase
MNHPLRVVFAGTPEFAVPHLHACRRDNVEIVAVYTQPDRPAGRGRSLSASPVKQAAQALGVAVEQPENFRRPGAVDRLRRLAPDLLIVVAYGLILPRKVLAIPTSHGCWNVHASLLPRWRGAAPIQRALLAGDTQTGVCLMQMEAGLDTGPVLLRRSIPIAADETGGTLHDKLAALGAALLAEGLERLTSGPPLTPQAQAAEGVTYAHKLEKAEARLDWNAPAEVIARKVRAFDPWPVAEAQLGGELLRIWKAAVVHDGTSAAPGSIVAAGRDGIDVACAGGVLRLLEVQRAGGRRMRAADLANSRPDLKPVR